MGTHSIWCLSSKQSSSVCLYSLFVKYKMEEEKSKCLLENMFFLIFYFSYFFSLSFSVYHFCSYSFFYSAFLFLFPHLSLSLQSLTDPDTILPLSRIQECSDLAIINGCCDPFATVTMHYTNKKQESKRTKVKKKTTCPNFNETFIFEVIFSIASFLHIHLWHILSMMYCS